MTSEAIGKPDVPKREIAIIETLRLKARRGDGGATASEIHKVVSASLGDDISRPAYYKLLDRLAAAGQIEQTKDESGRLRYTVPDNVHAGSPLTLDDVYEMLPYIKSTEAMANAFEAQQYFFENRDTVLREAAKALAEEPAVDAFLRWILDLLRMLEADVASYLSVEEEGPYVGEAVLADEALDQRLKRQCDQLRDVLYRQLSVSHEAVDVPSWDGPGGVKYGGRFKYDEQALREVLERRVFGIGERRTVLGVISVDGETLESAEREMVVSGSDGSFHAGTLGLQTAQGYVEDESFVVTINNGAAFIHPSEGTRRLRGGKEFFHSAPITRQTLDDPTYKGMALAPFMYPDLSESEYEHMARAASDVVQMRVDDEVFSGKARDAATGERISAPRVHIRDGTIAPQERQFNHYSLMNSYGDVAREGIDRSRSILERVSSSRGGPRCYVGAVKSTQVRLFSRFLNWYIAKGSKYALGDAIDPNWDISRAAYISDVHAMTELMASVEEPLGRTGFWMSCAVVRRFASLTEFFDVRIAGGETWLDMLRDRRSRVLEDYEQRRGVPSYLAIIGEDDLENDSYLYMLENADYASFYVGHTHGSPAPKIPRYELLCSLRDKNPDEAADYMEQSLRQVVTALLTTKFSEDRDHNFMSRVRGVKLIPYVVYRAHEYAKHLGKKLQDEYKSAVVAALSRRRQQRLNARDAELRPIGVRRFLQRYLESEEGLPPAERDDDLR